MRRPYPTVHLDHEESVPFPWGSGSKPTLEGGHLPLKSSTDNSHQAFKAYARPGTSEIMWVPGGFLYLPEASGHPQHL